MDAFVEDNDEDDEEGLGEEDENIYMEGEELGGDGEEMTPEELAEMTKDLFDTLRGNKKTVSVKTFLAWDDVQDMQSEGLLDDETLDALLSEVGTKGRDGELTYDQFALLIQMLEETAAALGDNMLDGEDGDEPPNAASVSKSMVEDADKDDEDGGDGLLEGLDQDGVEEIVREIYADLKGKSDALSVKDFKKWEDVSELLAEGVLQEKTLDVLISEVGVSNVKTGTLSFEQFWQLVNLLEEAADAATGDTPFHANPTLSCQSCDTLSPCKHYDTRPLNNNPSQCQPCDTPSPCKHCDTPSQYTL